MRRSILIALLSFGTVAGFVSGFAHHRHRAKAFERHIAEVCVQAARHAQPERK